MPAKASHSLFLGHGFLSLRIAGRSRDRSTKNNHSVALFVDPIAAWVEEESGSRRRKGLTVGTIWFIRVWQESFRCGGGE